MALFPSDIKLFAPPLKAWRQYRHQTGKLPFLSVVVYLLQFPVMLSSIAILVWYSSNHGWSNNKFVLVALAPSFALVWFWDWLQRTVQLMEFRRFRSRRS
jgi:hypothetical protein